MERIVIEVTDATAKRWRLSSQKRKEEMSHKINIKLAKELMADSKDEFIQFLNEVRATMKERGLTEDKLRDILKEEHDFEALLDKARDEAANNGLTAEVLQQLLNEDNKR